MAAPAGVKPCPGAARHLPCPGLPAVATMSRFVHLHVHSEYSLVDSTIRIPDLVRRCAELGQPSVAVTDRNNLFALVKFYRAAEAAGLKPIAGADVMVAEGDGPASLLTLLCRDHAGYLSLSRLLTRAWMEGHRHDGVVVRPEWLAEDSQGLFALAGRNSRVGQLLAGGREDLAGAALADLQRTWGEHCFLELTRCGLEGEELFNAFALHASSTRSIPVVASNDARFLDADGFEAHEARVCIASGRVLDDPRRPREYAPAQYLKSSEEMAELFADVPDAIDNTIALAQRCNIELRLGKYYLPAYPVPEGETLDTWIRREARDGLARRLARAPLAPGHTPESYAERLERELDVIVSMGFPGYFLIVSDFIRWAKEHGIPVGPGRGSGAGSLVAWALEITDLDVTYWGRSLLGFKGRSFHAVKGASLSIQPGQTLGLVGESGSGKTTLARVIIGLEPRTGGSIKLLGADVSGTVRERAQSSLARLQMVFQNPQDSLNPYMTIGQALRRPLMKLAGMNRRQADREVQRLLEAVSLRAEYAQRYPGELSGGEKQRVAIARAFASNPALIVCDEAVSALDVSVQSAVLNLLAELQQGLDTSYLFISHDLAVVAYLADYIAVMYLGQLYEVGYGRDLFLPPLHPYTEALVASIPKMDPQDHTQPVRLSGEIPSPRHMPSGCRFHTRCGFAKEICSREEPGMTVLGEYRRVSCHRAATMVGGGEW